MDGLIERVDSLLAMDDLDQIARTLLDDPLLRADEGLVATAIAVFQERSAQWPSASQATALVSLWLICNFAIPPAEKDYYKAVLGQVPAPAAAAALLKIGQICTANGLMNIASEMLRDGLAIGDEEASPQAALVLAAQSEPAEAERLYRLVLATWPAKAPAAQVQLGSLLNRQGLLDDAMLAYQQAAGSDDPLAAPRAMVNLGDLCRRVGDELLAQSWYEQAMAADNDYQADRAAVNLAALHLVRGELEAAAAACGRGLESVYPDLVEFAGKVRDQIIQQRRTLDDRRDTPEIGGIAPGEAAPSADAMRMLGRIIEFQTWYETYHSSSVTPRRSVTVAGR